MSDDPYAGLKKKAQAAAPDSDFEGLLTERKQAVSQDYVPAGQIPVSMNVRIPTAVRDAAKQMAGNDGMSLANFIAKLIQQEQARR